MTNRERWKVKKENGCHQELPQKAFDTTVLWALIQAGHWEEEGLDRAFEK